MRQHLGQHFLKDGKVIRTILASAQIAPSETVLEIGPGRGVLTVPLLDKAKRLVAVELDFGLAQGLEGRWRGRPGLEVVHADFLKVDLDALFPLAERPIKVLGNLPYSITSPIFEKLLAWTGWTTGVFLVQREVADRMRSAPGSRVYGVLSLAVQVFASVEQVLSVPPGAFSPPPDVVSSVIRVTRKPNPEVPTERIADFFDLVRGAFAHRRKTLLNSLSMHTERPKSELEQWIHAQGVSPGIRAETLGLPEYVRMAESWAIFRREMKLT